MSIVTRVTLVLMLIILISGCNKGSSDPVVPAPDDLLGGISLESTSDRTLWGIWKIAFDEESMSISIEPARQADVHVDVTKFILPPNCQDCLQIKANSFDPVTKLLDCDVTLKNPFQIGGYDVRGIFMTNDTDRTLLNADSWTGLWDIASGHLRNPFRAFATDDPNRFFAGQSEYTVNYQVYMSNFTQIFYAVDASWPDGCIEPYEIIDVNLDDDVFPQNASGIGISCRVHSWDEDIQGVRVRIETMGNPTPYYVLDLTNTSGDLYEGTIDISAADVPSGNLSLWIQAWAAADPATYIWQHEDVYIEAVAGTWTSYAKTWGGETDESANGLGVDDEGNCFISGRFYESVDFDPGPGEFILDSGAGYDAFLMKLNSNGEFEWAVNWGSGESVSGHDLDVGPDGTVWVTGFFSGNTDFDPGPGDAYRNKSKNWHDCYLTHFDSDGTFLGVHVIGGDYSTTTGQFVDVDALGNITLTGYFDDAVDFDPGPGEDEVEPQGADDIFVCKFNSSGVYEWVATWGTEFMGLIPAKHCGDSNGNVYIGGHMYSPIDLDPGPGTDIYEPVGYHDAWMVKLDAQGSYQWSRVWRGTDGYCKVEIANIFVDADSNIYTVGRLQDEADLDPGPGEDIHNSGNVSWMDHYIACMDSNGNHQWARDWGTFLYSEGNFIRVVADDLGGVFAGSYTKGYVDFDPGPEEDEPTPIGDYDSFLSRYSESGNYAWVTRFGGEEIDFINDMDLDYAGYIYILGEFYESADFDPTDGIENHFSDGDSDAYLIRLPAQGLSGIDEVTVEQPNGGDEWKVGYETTINWSWTGDLSKVDIDLSIDSGANFDIPIATDILNTGTHDLTPVAGWLTSTARVRVRDAEAPSNRDQSDADFSIIEFVNQLPVAIAQSDSTTAQVYESIGFSDNGSYDPDGGDITLYEWDWENDGLFDSNGSMVNHNWPAAGTYYVQFRVTDDEATTDTLDTPIQINITPSTEPPPTVTGFNASDADQLLNPREVKLTWDQVMATVDYYDIEKLVYAWGPDMTPGSFVWGPVASVPGTQLEHIDTDVRYSGAWGAVRYRIKARNSYGSSPDYVYDRGHPIKRNVKISFWCWAENTGGTNAVTTWDRAMDDLYGCNLLWRGYGVNFEMENSGDFHYVTNPAWKNITGTEDELMHNASGKAGAETQECINVYYVDTVDGGPQGAYAIVYCDPNLHNTRNTFIVIYGPATGLGMYVLAHENGHAMGRLYDTYLVDGNGSGNIESGETCEVSQTGYCPGYSWRLFCDEAGCYPQDGDPDNPRNLMWYGEFLPFYDSDLVDSQFVWVDAWLSNHEGNYPWP